MTEDVSCEVKFVVRPTPDNTPPPVTTVVRGGKEELFQHDEEARWNPPASDRRPSSPVVKKPAKEVWPR
ncbi:MAG: hypothetical protein WCT11_02365 [Candidatus Magasanikbacteria bacterium]